MRAGFIFRRFYSTFFKSISMNHGPLVVVLGATGAGKSKLALDLGQRLNGEIISADSMQVYCGLDIVTNKVTAEELAICPHHLIGFLPPLQEYTIVDFKKHAMKAIEEIQLRKRLPIVCGGTNYYIEALLWEYLIPTNENILADTSTLNELSDRKAYEEKDCLELHNMLKEVDPERAAMLHPHDKRKVVRSIEVFRQSGKKHSELMENQKETTEENDIGGPLLFSNTCLIYVQCDDAVSKERIDKRVDKMIEMGLLDELKVFHKEYNKERLEKGLNTDYKHGIFQSIGFKEFHEYLTTSIVDKKEKQELLNCAIERMKLSTWQYFKYQKKWIHKRIINGSKGILVYPVDSTNPELWDRNVLAPALELLNRTLKWGEWVEGVDASCKTFEETRNFDFVPIEAIDPGSRNRDNSLRVKNECQDCGGQIFITEKQWEVHITSKRHKKRIASKHRKLENTVGILEERKRRLEHRNEGVPKQENVEISQEILFKGESNS